MDMMNSCSAVIPFKCLVFSLNSPKYWIDLSWYKNLLWTWNSWVAYAWSKSRWLTNMIWDGLSCYLSSSIVKLSFRVCSFEKWKINDDEFLYDNAQIPTNAIYIYIRKTFHLYAACICVEFCQALLTLMRSLSCF